eukprot:COSAG06_NODE_2774_length_6303_cov_15.722115_6_plen_54_part_00
MLYFNVLYIGYYNVGYKCIKTEPALRRQSGRRRGWVARPRHSAAPLKGALLLT